MTNRATINRMTAEILDIAEANGIDVTWRKDLVLKTDNRKGRSRGGKRSGKPYMSVAMRNVGWDFNDPDAVAERLRLWTERLDNSAERRLRDPKARKWVNAFERINLAPGDGVWMEYPAIAKDPEIGNLYGPADDELKPLATLLCHELAHVIDYNSGEVRIGGRKYGPCGSVHGTKWREIYRLLRTSYVATGKYKPEVIEFKPRTKPATDERKMDLIGLPLFDLAA